MQGERNGEGARQEGGEAGGGTETVGQTVNRAARLPGQPGKVVVPAESRADVNGHGFWKQGTTAMFDIRIVNLDAGSYLRITTEKALAKADKEKKNLYLQACLERRRTFTPVVYSADGIPGSGGISRAEEVSRATQLQAEAGIL